MKNVIRSNPQQQESPKSASMDVVTIFILFQQNHLLKLSILSYRNLAKISFPYMDWMLYSTSFSFKLCKVTVSLAQTLFLEVTPEHTMFISTDTMLILVPGMRWIEMNCDDSATHVKYSDRFVAHALDTEFLIPEALTCSSKQVLTLDSEHLSKTNILNNHNTGRSRWLS